MPSKWALRQRAIQPRNRIAMDDNDKPIVRDMSPRPWRAASMALNVRGVKRKIRRSFG